MTHRHRFTTLLVTVAAIVLIGTVVTLANGAIPGQAVVRVGNGHGAGNAFNGAGVQVIDSIPELRLYLVQFPAQIPFESKRDDLMGQAGVQVVEPNYQMDMLETYQMSISFPDESVPVNLDGEAPPSFYDQPAVYSIGLDSAQLIASGEGVTVAVIDNGVDRTHPLFNALADSMTHDFVDRDADASEAAGTLYGHGTFVAGLVRLAAPNCTLLVARAFDGEGLSNSFTVSQAINWAVQHGADVINMSFGTLTNSQVLAQACQRAIDLNVILVASVGNAELVDTPIYPAVFPGVIAVSSIGPDDQIAAFANSFNGVDVAAPGISLYSALPGPYYWGTWSGTSFSAPLVAAICALDRSLSGLTPMEAEANIQATATRDLTWGTVTPPDPYYGYGRVDAYNSVLQLSLGDMNNSGTLDVSDLNVVNSIVTGGEVPTHTIIRQGDMNGDGVVDQADIDIIVNQLFKKNSPH